MAILADVAPYSREYQVFPSCLPQNPSRASAGGRRRCRHSPVRRHSPVCTLVRPPACTPELRLSASLNYACFTPRIRGRSWSCFPFWYLP
jgi:hypothetical protein